MTDQTMTTGTTITPTGTNLGEAPAIIFTKVYGMLDGQVIEFNVTSRGTTVQEAMDKLFDGIRYGKERYKLSPIRPDWDARADNRFGNRTEPAPAVIVEPAGARPASLSNGNGNGSKIIHAVKMDIAPEADDKVTLKWYASGHEHPDITTKRTTAKALELLQSTNDGFEERDLWRASSRSVRHAIHYHDSEKLNTKGNPYKDIDIVVSE